MAYNQIGGFPPQQLPLRRKNKAWRQKCTQFGCDHSLLHYSLARKSVMAMQLNYDLMNGKIHMDDMKLVVNPYGIDASFISDNIQHYSMINAKLKVLEGEESRRLFDYRVVVTNPNAVSEVEEEKNQLVNQRLQQLLQDSSQSEEDFQNELQNLSDYFQYDYQDKREVRANRLLNHYSLEQDFSQKFNLGFRDGYTVGEEIYQCDIVGGEPVLEKLNPRDVRIIRSGFSNNIEDADMIVIEQYWQPGRVIDTYYDQLSPADVKKIDEGSWNNSNTYADSMDNIDARRFAILPFDHPKDGWVAGDKVISSSQLFEDDHTNSLLPYDFNGNVRVLRVYWKSRRKIKKVKSYDPETGEEQFDFREESYVIDPYKGEEEQIYWVNEAWEGTKIGEDIFINMRPRPVQYNRLSNPSRCHFGIVGSVYTSNTEEPYSMVDIMKPYAYLYDVIHDRLNKTLAKNVGKVIRLDFAKVPKGWDADKWLYYINVNGVAVENSFREGDVGRSTGVMAGSLNNASNGVIDASLGNEVLFYTNVLDWIDTHCGNLVGMTPQRMGQVSNRETVGGVERATLQSSHSTEWLFVTHESVKKRVLECFLETAKIALKGRKKKFEFILEDGSRQIMEIDGDEFAECDYGLVVDNSNGAQELHQKLDMLGQAALQNQTLDFSAIMKLYTTKSLSEKQRIIEANERRLREMRQQEQQQQLQMQQQQLQQQMAMKQAEMELEYKMHQEKMQAQILISKINGEAEANRLALMNEEKGLTVAQEMQYKERQLSLDAEQFNKKLEADAKQQDKQLAFNREKLKADTEVRKQQIAKSNHK